MSDKEIDSPDSIVALVDRILADDYDSRDLDATINAIHRSGDPGPLLLLFDSPSQTAQLNAIFILSEVGNISKPLLAKAAEFTGHAHWQARYWALDCILAGSGSEDGAVLAAATLLLRDPDQRVRSRAINFIARLDPGQVAAAQNALSARREDAAAGALSRFLEYSLDRPDELLADAKSDDAFRRACSLAFAARAIRIARKVARRASRAIDPAAMDFAQSLL
jgi:hypothetical protein